MTKLSEYFPNKYPASVYTPALGGWTGTTKSTEVFVHGTGNKVTWITQLRIPEFAGTNSAAVFNVGVGSGAAILAFAYPTEFATVGQRKKLIITVRNSGGTDLCSLASDIDFTDGELHSVLFAYDGTAGVATFTIDGKDADDLSFATRTLTTGTIPTTTLTWALAGAWWANSNYLTGDVGFIGMDDSYISNYSLFFDSDNNPIKQDTDDWSQSGWGVQPNVWNEYGYLPDNKGSIGLFSAGPKYFTDEPEITGAFFGLGAKTHDYVLTNPGAESGDMTGWTTETGTGFETQVAADVPGLSPRTGTYYFGGDNQLWVSSYQDVIATAGDFTVDDIDAGKLLIKVTYYAASYNGNDEVRMYCRFYDGLPGNVITNDHDIGDLIPGPTLSWEKREYYMLAPPGTRTIRLKMQGHRTDGTYCNSHLDDISLSGFLIA